MLKFYRCAHCGNVAEKLVDKGVSLVCCGENMEELIPNTVDAAFEKHVPDVVISGNTVEISIGSIAHPMIEPHFIQFVVLETNKGVYRVNLKPGDAPKAVFHLEEKEKAVEVYAYCNLHGLWSKRF
ncbi:MAG: desulfoferrodoxin [Bacilli bacterium]|nr:desulfoferrodoxin [Bacilli bacterium]